MTPTARTLKRCRDHGWLAGVTERFNHHTKRRHDLLGFVDILALADGRFIGIQATSGSNGASRVAKIRQECGDAAREWLKCGGRIEVWAWRKRLVKRGGKAVRWEPRVVSITAKTLEASQ